MESGALARGMGAFVKVAHSTKAELPGDPRSLGLEVGGGVHDELGSQGWVHSQLFRCIWDYRDKGERNSAQGCRQLEAPLLP